MRGWSVDLEVLGRTKSDGLGGIDSKTTWHGPLLLVLRFRKHRVADVPVWEKARMKSFNGDL